MATLVHAYGMDIRVWDTVPTRPTHTARTTSVPSTARTPITVQKPTVHRLRIPSGTRRVLDAHFRKLAVSISNAMQIARDKRRYKDMEVLETKFPYYVSDCEIINKRYYPSHEYTVYTLEKFIMVDREGNRVRRTLYLNTGPQKTFMHVIDDVFRWFATKDRYLWLTSNINTSALPGSGNNTFMLGPWTVTIKKNVIPVVSDAHRTYLQTKYGRNVNFFTRHTRRMIAPPGDPARECTLGPGTSSEFALTSSVTWGKASESDPHATRNYRESDNIDIDLGDDDSAPQVRRSNVPRGPDSQYLAFGYKIADLRTDTGAPRRQCVVKLGITHDKSVRMNKSIGSNGKVRVNKAHVIAIAEIVPGAQKPGGVVSSSRLVPVSENAHSFHDNQFIYEVGKDVCVPNYDNSSCECSAGIHFFFHPESAIREYASGNPMNIDNLTEFMAAYTATELTGELGELGKFESAPLPVEPYEDDAAEGYNASKRKYGTDAESVVRNIESARKRRITLRELSLTLDALDLELKQYDVPSVPSVPNTDI